MAGPDVNFWQQRFESKQTPWDRQAANPQLSAWLQSGVIGAGTRVLVPGCGSGYELVQLAQRGCVVIGIDYAPSAVRINQPRRHPSAGTPVKATDFPCDETR